MKVITAVILSLGFLAVCSGLPASKKDDVEFVPPERSPFGDKPIVDTGAFDGWGGPFSNPFGGLFENIESVMTRMRQQIEDLLKRFPLKRGNSTEEIPDFALEGLPVFPRFGDIDLGKANKTSVTKVIDGHKVVINETAYENQDDLGGTFFKVRIIDVKPDSSEQTTEKEAETIPDNNKDRESSENSFENEIPKSKEVGTFNNIETFDEMDSSKGPENITRYSSAWNDDANPTTLSDNSISSIRYRNTEWDDVKPVQILEDNSLGSVEKLETPQLPLDLSRDTYVNQILLQSGAPTNPDAEVFFIPENPREEKQLEKIFNPR